MNNIMLTGEKQIGKSTIVNFILEDFQGVIRGFRTLPEKDKNLYFLSSLNSKAMPAEKAYICKKNSNGSFEGIPSVFDNSGATILRNCLKELPDLIVMDELGLFESEAFKFQEIVFKCMNSTIPVLGVLKEKSSPFLDLIKNREDTIIFTITKDNRNKLKEIIKQTLYKYWD